jgi:hypothetical protein
LAELKAKREERKSVRSELKSRFVTSVQDGEKAETSSQKDS